MAENLLASSTMFERDSDVDSAIGDDAATETTTVASWIYDYRLENGRTYHAFQDGKYWGPNDYQALEHLDLAHALFTKTFDGKLFLAPLDKDPIDVLDLGTGTGIWALDFADEFPSATVIGTDLSPVQPTWIPSNCQFEIDDMEQEWTFEDNKFDLIHIRALHGSIQDWHKLYTQCLRCLKPGGYIEQAEYAPFPDTEDAGFRPDSPMIILSSIAAIGEEKTGRDFRVFQNMTARIKEVGFVEVVEHNFKWPIGTWPKDKTLKELGVWTRAHLDMGLENWFMRVCTTLLGWSQEKVYTFCAELRQELRNKDAHLIHRMNVVYGRKPYK